MLIRSHVLCQLRNTGSCLEPSFHCVALLDADVQQGAGGNAACQSG